MKKHIALSLLYCSLTVRANNFIETHNFTIPQTQKEKKEAAQFEQNTTYAGSLFTGALCTIVASPLILECAGKNQKEAICNGIITFLGLSIISYPIWKKFTHGSHSDYAPLNEELQKILKAKYHYNFNLIYIANNAETNQDMIDTYMIEYSRIEFPLVAAYNELQKILSFSEAAHTNLNYILREHKELTYVQDSFVCESIHNITSIILTAKTAMSELKKNNEYKNQLEEKRRIDLYNAEMKRIQAETEAASMKAYRDKAQAKQAQEQAVLANARSNQIFWDTVLGRPKNPQLHVHI